MVRFYKSYLGRMILGLLILVELEKESGKAGVATAIAKWKGGSDYEKDVVNQALDSYVHGYDDESPSNDDVLKGALGQLTKPKKADGDLLDVVVAMLNLPFINYLSSSTIRSLRDAILTPGELMEVKKIIKSSSKCGCGHQFENSEMTSVMPTAEGIILQCTKCARPNYVRCDHCDNMVLISGKVASTWRNSVDCGCTKTVANNPDPIAQLLQDRHQAAAADRILRRARQARAAIPMNWNDVVPTAYQVNDTE
jgi:hypothetical protein